jgi:hypothetical protein
MELTTTAMVEEKDGGLLAFLVKMVVFVRRSVYYLYSGVTFGVHMMGPNASEQTIEVRKKICDQCTHVDSYGDRLYRHDAKGVYTCGKPLFAKKLRNPQREGCGCFLSLKWKKRWTECPLAKW